MCLPGIESSLFGRKEEKSPNTSRSPDGADPFAGSRRRHERLSGRATPSLRGAHGDAAILIDELSQVDRRAIVDIRDNIDEFMNDLKRQGKWASWAASMAALSVALQGVDQLLK